MAIVDVTTISCSGFSITSELASGSIVLEVNKLARLLMPKTQNGHERRLVCDDRDSFFCPGLTKEGATPNDGRLLLRQIIMIIIEHRPAPIRPLCFTKFSAVVGA